MSFFLQPHVQVSEHFFGVVSLSINTVTNILAIAIYVTLNTVLTKIKHWTQRVDSSFTVTWHGGGHLQHTTTSTHQQAPL